MKILKDSSRWGAVWKSYFIPPILPSWNEDCGSWYANTRFSLCLLIFRKILLLEGMRKIFFLDEGCSIAQGFVIIRFPDERMFKKFSFYFAWCYLCTAPYIFWKTWLFDILESRNNFLSFRYRSYQHWVPARLGCVEVPSASPTRILIELSSSMPFELACTGLGFMEYTFSSTVRFQMLI